MWHGGGHFGCEDEHECAVCHILLQNANLNSFEIIAVAVIFIIIKILGKTFAFSRPSFIKLTIFSRAPPDLI
jgi:hypothetical protein